jgi:hypothetical protein
MEATQAPTGEARRILLELGADGEGDVGKVALFKRADRGGTFEWVDTWEDPAGFSLEAVRARFGGGDYQAKLHKPDGTYLAGPQFKIAGPSKSVAPDAAAAPAAGGELAELRAQIVELKALIAGRSASNPALDMVQIMVPLMTAMSTAATAGMAPLLEALAKRDKPSDPLSSIETLSRLMELVDSRRGEDGMGGYGGVVKELGIPLFKGLQEMAARAEPPVPHTSALPPAPPPAAPEIGTGHPPPPWVHLIRGQIPQLLHLALARGDVDFWAAQVIQGASDEQVSFLADLLDDGDAGRAQFFSWFPETMEHRTWFERLFDALDAQLPQAEGGGEEGDG